MLDAEGDLNEVDQTGSKHIPIHTSSCAFHEQILMLDVWLATCARLSPASSKHPLFSACATVPASDKVTMEFVTWATACDGIACLE